MIIGEDRILVASYFGRHKCGGDGIWDDGDIYPGLGNDSSKYWSSGTLQYAALCFLTRFPCLPCAIGSLTFRLGGCEVVCV